MGKEYPIKRNGYYHIKGEKYPSVTKILGDTLNKPQLLYWYQREIARIALDDPSLTEKEVIAALSLRVKETQQRGTYIHELAENYPNVEHIVKPELDIDCGGYVKALENYHTTMKPKVVMKEQILYSTRYKVAGRFDQVQEINGRNWLIDYKTGKNLYKELELQLVIYKSMLEEDGFTIDHMGGVLLKENGDFVMQECHGKVENFLKVRDVWLWMKGKENL